MSGTSDRRRGRALLGLSSARFSRRCEILFITCVVCSVVLSFELGDENFVSLSSSNSASMGHFIVVGDSLESKKVVGMEP